MTRKPFDGTLKAPSASDIAEFEAWADAIPPLPCSVLAQDVPYHPAKPTGKWGRSTLGPKLFGGKRVGRRAVVVLRSGRVALTPRVKAASNSSWRMWWVNKHRPSRSSRIEAFSRWAETIAVPGSSITAQDEPCLRRVDTQKIASEPAQKRVWVHINGKSFDASIVQQGSRHVVSSRMRQHADVIMAVLKDIQGGVDASRASKGKPRNRQAG